MANDDNNSINPNWTVGNSANSGHENDGNELNVLKLEMIALKVFIII
jgi:hypothetical protein